MIVKMKATLVLSLVALAQCKPIVRGSVSAVKVASETRRRLVIKDVDGTSAPNSPPGAVDPAPPAPVTSPSASGLPSTAPLAAPPSVQPAPGITVPVTSAPVATAPTLPPSLTPTVAQPSQVPTVEKAPVSPPTPLVVTASDSPSDVPSLTPSQIPSLPPAGDVPATAPTPEATAPTPVNNDPDDGANGVGSGTTSSALRVVTTAYSWLAAAIPMVLGITLCLW